MINDLCNRLRHEQDDISLFIDDIIQYLSSKSWEVRLNLGKTIPDLDTYIEMRRYGGGLYPCFEIACVGETIKLPTWLQRGDAHLKILTAFANDLVIVDFPTPTVPAIVITALLGMLYFSRKFINF